MSEIFQTALIKSLALGHFEGFITVRDLLSRGDTGIGTFDSLDGELVLLGGTPYQAKADGTVVIPSPDTTVPFCDVTFFTPDASFTLADVPTFSSLTASLDGLVAPAKNHPHFVTVRSVFRSVTVRSVRPQTKPYPTLTEAMSNDQTVCTRENVPGTAVGIYCPAYMDSLSVPGWHLHFISDDRTFAGHILDLSFNKAEASLEKKTSLSVTLPDSPSFDSLDLSADLSAAVEKAEKGTF